MVEPIQSINPLQNKIIYNHQLRYQKYDIKLLEENIDHLSLKTLLITQYLPVTFCVKYLLNPDKYAMCIEDTYISKEDILIYQKHITQKELV